MKKTTIIFSFILISVFSTGSYLLHLMHLENYKKDFKEYIIKHHKESGLTNIEIKTDQLFVNSASILWEDDNQEIVYKDKLYDIIAIKYHGDHIIITVASDEQEMALKKEFASIYNTNSHNGAKGPYDLLKNFFALKYLVNNVAIKFSNTECFCLSHSISPVFRIPSMVINLDTPPPDSFI